MKAILPTCFIPPISYLAMFLNYKNIEIEIYESFPKQTLRNRTYISTANGILPLIVPVVKVNGNHTLTKDITISYNTSWQITQWRAICSAYNKSPFFIYYQQDIEQLFFKQYPSLLEFNSELLKYFLSKCIEKMDVNYTTQYQKDVDITLDYRTIDFYALQNDFFIKNPQYAYTQVFSHKYPFQSQVNVLDALFNLGPDVKTVVSDFQKDFKLFYFNKI